MKKEFIIVAISLIVIAGIIVGVSYAFFSVGGIQSQANTFSSGCLNISLTDASSSINLTNTYPITDVEGLEGTSYDFTITNTCDTSANYQINLESLNKQANSLNADYIKVSLSSDTNDNVISILSSNTSVTPTIDGAYESYNLYTGTLAGNETKTYHLKLWIDYDATVEQAASKTYQSKINVIANPETEVIDTLEAQFSIDNTTVTSTLSSNVTSATYCVTETNICTPSTNATITNNSYTLELEKTKQVSTALGNLTVNESSTQVVCTTLNETSKIICSNPNKINTPDFSKTSQENCEGIDNCEETNGIYEAEDDYGTTYYYRGSIDNNWVSFAGYYWRIIRINGDGSIRMIYSGDSESGPVETGETTQIGMSAFNEQYNDNAYVGYMYGVPGSDTYEETHANINDSTIKTVLDNWYGTNLASYSQYISTEQGFCNDRRIAISSETWWTSDTKLGYGTNATAYAPFSRFLITSDSWASTQNPILKCNQTNDYSTVDESGRGNHALDYPIGLITIDEVVLAGGFGGTSNSSYYLYTNQYYWTMSPYRFSTNGNAGVFYVYSDGHLGRNNVNSAWGVRPVINLDANVTLTGSGTSTDPYRVS